jgi:hypothetical protein
MTQHPVTLPTAVALYGDPIPGTNQTGFSFAIVDANTDDLNLMAGRACLLCDQPVSKPFRVLLVTSERLRCERPICMDCVASGTMEDLIEKFNEALTDEFHSRKLQ